MKGASTEEMKRAIAAVFLGEGLEEMTEEQILSAISMKRRWFTPEKAKIFIENGIRAGFLGVKGKYLCPTFQYEDTEIPFGYYPSESVLETGEEDMTERIGREWKLSEEEMKSALSMEYNLEDEVKILLWGAQNGRDYRNLIHELEHHIMEKYKKNYGFN